jgi:CDP-diglyceride synthetase
VYDNGKLYVIVLVSDVYQYVGGHVLKLHESKPFPELSPKKSMGGYVFALVVGAISFTYSMGWDVQVVLAVQLLGFVGDLVSAFVWGGARAHVFARMNQKVVWCLGRADRWVAWVVCIIIDAWWVRCRCFRACHMPMPLSTPTDTRIRRWQRMQC